MDLIKMFIEKGLYPLMEMRKGNKIRRYTVELIKTQKLPLNDLKALQKDKLKALLFTCVDQVPAYKEEAKLKAVIEADPYEALDQFPILEKLDFSHHSERYLNPYAPKGEMIPNRTGGSTSEPIQFIIDRCAVEHYEAARWRGLSWWGITVGSRSVMIWGNPIELNQTESTKYRMKDRWLKNRIVIPAYALQKDQIRNYVENIRSYKPEYIYGYSSALYAFSQLMLQQELKISVQLKAVVSTAEVLHDFQRESIEKAFGCSVVNEYGARDGGILAFQCKAGHMHISYENAFIEVIDPQTKQRLPYGQRGHLLVTDLNNFSMPRLRYKLGDQAVLSDRVCSCGLGLPIMESIDGREDDMFLTSKGGLVHGHVFNHISRSLESFSQFQLIQLSPILAELYIVMDEAANTDEVDYFVEEIKKILHGSTIEIKFVDHIPTTPSGKYRYAIRKFDL